MLRFSSQSMRAYAALYRPYNEIDIYVEDRTLVGLYERLFNTFASGRATISAVIPLKNKQAVIEEARKLSHDLSRKRFFLIDGDFDWAVGKRRRVPKLYMLKCYSVENLAWESGAIYAAAHSLSTQLTRSQVEAKCMQADFEKTVNLLLPLFVTYSVGSSLKTTNSTTSYSAMRLMSSTDPSSICELKARSRLRMIYRLLSKEFGAETTVNQRRKLTSLLRQRNFLDSRLISGKDYLLPVLQKIFELRFNYRGTQRQLLSLVLNHSRFTIDRGLRPAFARALRADPGRV